MPPSDIKMPSLTAKIVSSGVKLQKIGFNVSIHYEERKRKISS